MGQTINVNFVSDAGFVNHFGENDGYQLKNSNFEAWTASSGEPDYWHGFKSCTGDVSSLVGIAGMSLEKSSDSHGGSYSALLTSGGESFLVSAVANGTMTTGQLNAGSSTAADVKNHSHMDKSSSEKDNNGKPFYMEMFGRPDAFKTWIKFSKTTANNNYPYATVSTIIFDGTYYQDPEDKEYTNVTAKAQDKNIAVTDWRELTVPFDYASFTSNNATPGAILVTVSTNATPGQGHKKDKVWVDDMELVYYGEVTGITVNGLDNFAFDAATHTYNVEAPGEFTEDDVTVTKTGAYSYLLKSVNAIEGGYVITVTVIPNDMSKAEVYTIYVTTPEVQPNVYILGDVNGNTWATNVGAQMEYDADQDIYTATVSVNDIDGFGYFGFTTALAETPGDWDGIAASRFGAVAEGDNFLVTTENQGSISLTAGGKTLQIRPGEYTLTMSGDRSSLSIAGDIVDPFFIAGTFTNWQNGKLAMNYDNGSYSITVNDVTDGAEFKFIDADNNWYGGLTGDNAYVVHPYWCTDIELSTSGQNFRVSGSGDLTFTVDANKKLSITGWDEQGVTLAEALAGEEGNVLIISDMKVVVSNNAYAIVSDGNGNWLKLTGQSFAEGDVIGNVAGTISGLDLNPVMAVTSYQASEAIVDVAPTSLNLGTIHREALTALKSNEVAYFVGYYNAQTGELCAFSPDHGYGGLHIAMTTDNMTGSIVSGKQQKFTGVVSLKQAWDAPSGAPARVAIDDDQAFENIQIDATSASVATGVEAVKAIDGKEIQGIYNVNGQQVKSADKGVYIIRYTDGTAAKVRF